MKNNMGLFIDEMKTAKGFEIVIEKMENLVTKFDELGKKVYAANGSGGGFNVLNHGDFHFNNMVFKKDSSGKLCDVLFVSCDFCPHLSRSETFCSFQLDFQLAKWGSPCIDIFYLLYMVASEEARESRDEIVAHYYKEFVATLKNIGYMLKPPTILELNLELLKNGFMEVVIAVCFLPYLFLDPHSQDVELAYENGVEGTMVRKSLYRNEDYKKAISKLVSRFLYNGFFD